MSETFDCLVLGRSPLAHVCCLELVRCGLRAALVEVAEQEALADSGLTDFSAPVLGDHFWALSESLGSRAAGFWWQMAQQGAEHLRGLVSDCPSTLRGSHLLVASNATEAEEMTRSLKLLSDSGFEVRMMSGAAASNFAPLSKTEGAMLLGGAVVFSPSELKLRLQEALDSSGVPRLCMPVDSELLAFENEVLVACEDRTVHAEVSIAFDEGPSSLNRLSNLIEMDAIATRGQVQQNLFNSVVLASFNRGHEFYWNGSQSQFKGPQPFEMLSVNPAQLDPEPFEAYSFQTAQQRITEISRWNQPPQWSRRTLLTTPDGLPIIGSRPGYSRSWVAGGFGIFRNSLGVGAALEVAKAVAGHTNRLSELGSCSPRRFARRR